MSNTNVIVTNPGNANSHGAGRRSDPVRAWENCRHPPCNDVESRQTCIQRELAEKRRYRQQDGRERRIQKFEIAVGISGIKVCAVKHLLPRPEPERVVLRLSASPYLWNEDVGCQRDTADQIKNVERGFQPRKSEHIRFPNEGGRSPSSTLSKASIAARCRRERRVPTHVRPNRPSHHRPICRDWRLPRRPPYWSPCASHCAR